MFKCEEIKVRPGGRKQSKSRIYVWPQGETIIQNLQNRRDRPYTAYRKEVLPGVLAALGIHPDTVKIRWSQHAGCTMCPCSPGFIVDGYIGENTGRDIHVTVS